MKLNRLRGLATLVHDSIDQTVDLVEDGHSSVARTVMKVLTAVPPLAAPARLVDDVRRISTAGVLATVRGVNHVVENVNEVALGAAEATLERANLTLEPEPVPMRSSPIISVPLAIDAALGLVNGVVGDRLVAQNNGLSLPMQLRLKASYLPTEPETLQAALAGVSSKLVILVHGLCTTEWSWCLKAAEYHGDPEANFGTLLAHDLGYTPVWVRYNSGRHVSENGRELSQRLEALIAAWPTALTEVLLIGHSMGGLVLRSACHYACEGQLTWVQKVRRIFCLGTPHQGAALEKLGHVASAVLRAIDTPGTRITGRLLQGRSAGIKDLRRGSLVDEDWLEWDPDALRTAEMCDIPLLEGATHYFISATVTSESEHPFGRIIGDLLVRVPSASGPSPLKAEFPIKTKCFGNIMHHELQNHPDVYAQIRAACEVGGVSAPEAAQGVEASVSDIES